MPLSHILAQPAAIGTLERALRAGRVHHAYRFEGPDGVGKEMAAFALAQALVCTSDDPLGCGRCDACRRATTLSTEEPHTPLHPDVVVLERGLYAPDAIGRKSPEASEISVDQIRRMVLSHASFPPHEGKARVFIVRRADELSVGAANAMLKTLEEPRNGTHFILLTARGEKLLPTIRSRTLPVRFAPLPDDVIRMVLRAAGKADSEHDLAVELAAGSASAALALTDREANDAREAFIASVLAAIEARDLGPAVTLSEARDRDKHALKDDLRALGAHLARVARSAVAEAPGAAVRAAKQYEAVARAVIAVERNASTSLNLVRLIADMREVA